MLLWPFARYAIFGKYDVGGLCNGTSATPEAALILHDAESSRNRVEEFSRLQVGQFASLNHCLLWTLCVSIILHGGPLPSTCARAFVFLRVPFHLGFQGQTKEELTCFIHFGEFPCFDTLSQPQGILAGLVSITAGCGNMESGCAVATGFVGALVYQGGKGRSDTGVIFWGNPFKHVPYLGFEGKP